VGVVAVWLVELEVLTACRALKLLAERLPVVLVKGVVQRMREWVGRVPAIDLVE
jgi:hypothetical protein